MGCCFGTPKEDELQLMKSSKAEEKYVTAAVLGPETRASSSEPAKKPLNRMPSAPGFVPPPLSPDAPPAPASPAAKPRPLNRMPSAPGFVPPPISPDAPPPPASPAAKSARFADDRALGNQELSLLLNEINKAHATGPAPTERTIVLGDFNNEFLSDGTMAKSGIHVSVDPKAVVGACNSLDKYHKDEEGYEAADRAYVLQFHARPDAEQTLINQSIERKGWRGGDLCLAGPEAQLRVASGCVPSVADERTNLPASDHAPMSYELHDGSGGDGLRALVYNVCWEIFEPSVAIKLDKGSGPTGRILVPLADKCTANVLRNVVTLCATHDLVVLEEVPRPKAGQEADGSEKALAWGRMQAALESIDTHAYVSTQNASSGLVTLYRKARFELAPAAEGVLVCEGSTENKERGDEASKGYSRPYMLLQLRDRAHADTPLWVYHVHCGPRFRFRNLREKAKAAEAAEAAPPPKPRPLNRMPSAPGFVPPPLSPDAPPAPTSPAAKPRPLNRMPSAPGFVPPPLSPDAPPAPTSPAAKPRPLNRMPSAPGFVPPPLSPDAPPAPPLSPTVQPAAELVAAAAAHAPVVERRCRIHKQSDSQSGYAVRLVETVTASPISSPTHHQRSASVPAAESSAAVVGSMARLQEIQAECLADDIDTGEHMLQWTEARLTSYFENGGVE